MLTLPLISLIAFYLLKVTLEGTHAAHHARLYHVVGLLFFRWHLSLWGGLWREEVTNYLHTRFCLAATPTDICRIIIFNDDEFAHWVWFAGFVFMNAALLFTQALFRQAQPAADGDLVWLVVNGLFIALDILRQSGL